MTITTDDFRKAMRHLTGHVCLITSADNLGSRNGLTATAVCSISAEPPTLLCSIYSKMGCLDTIMDSQSFAVNVLAHTDKHLADRFASSIRGEERFEEGDWRTLETGAPILQSALAGFDCNLAKSVTMHTHTIIFGEVQGVHVSRIKKKPLLYAHGSYGGFAKRGSIQNSDAMWLPDWDFTFS